MFIVIWAWLMHHFYIVEGQVDIFRMWMLIGFPFGIYRIRLWLIPRNFDLGGTGGVGKIQKLGFVIKSQL